jgi:hypothetical protein
LAVFRPSTGVWYLQRSSLGFTGIAFGTSEDKPAAADYDGDGKADVARISQRHLVFAAQPIRIYRHRLRRRRAIRLFQQISTATGSGCRGISRRNLVSAASQAGFTGIAFGSPTDRPVPNAFIP